MQKEHKVAIEKLKTSFQQTYYNMMNTLDIFLDGEIDESDMWRALNKYDYGMRDKFSEYLDRFNDENWESTNI